MDELDKAKLDLETRRVVVEERKAQQGFWTRVGVVIPIAAALIAFGASLIVQRLDARDALALQERKANHDFELKVAEILMSVEGPYETRGRAVALRQIFPGRLGPQFALDFNPEDATNRAAYERDQRVAAKKELLKLIAEHPQERQQIIETGKSCSPVTSGLLN